jgi:hypothetical protein
LHSTDATHHPHFPFMQALAQRIGEIELVHVDREYAGYEPTLWRMSPLWDEDVNLLLCRDVDSVPTVDELRAVRVFCAQESPAVQGIRSYRLHNTLLLAGLCGFKNERMGFFREEIGSFEHYWAIYQRLDLRGAWGCDQQMLALTLGRHPGRILDSTFGDVPALPLPVVTLGPDVYDGVKLNDLPRELLQICDQMSSFAGQPLDDTRPALRKMLSIDTPVVSALRDVLGQFPKVERELLR